MLLMILILPNHAVRKWKRFLMSVTVVQEKSEKDTFTVEAAVLSQNKNATSPPTKKSFRRQKKGLSVQHTRIYNA